MVVGLEVASGPFGGQVGWADGPETALWVAKGGVEGATVPGVASTVQVGWVDCPEAALSVVQKGEAADFDIAWGVQVGLADDPKQAFCGSSLVTMLVLFIVKS